MSYYVIAGTGIIGTLHHSNYGPGIPVFYIMRTPHASKWSTGRKFRLVTVDKDNSTGEPYLAACRWVQDMMDDKLYPKEKVWCT